MSQKCINFSSLTYTGRENSPFGLGYAPNPEFTGKIMNGKDNKLYIIKSGTKHKKWVKFDIDIDELPDDCYHEAKIPNTTKITSDEETGLEEKIGGHKPFFVEGDIWPSVDGKALTFFGQFKHPDNEKVLIQVFVNTFGDIGSEYEIMDIELNEENIKNQVIITNNDLENSEIFNAHKINKYNLHTELKPLSFLYKRLCIPENSDFEKKYYDSNYYPRDSIKLNGTSIHCQSPGQSYNFIQINECNELPFGWGDCGIAHVKKEKYGGYYFTWDCY